MTPEDIAVKLQDHDNRIKSLQKRMDEVEKNYKILNEITTHIETLAVNMEYMAKEQQKQGERLERLEQGPIEDEKYYKRTVIGTIISGVIGALIGAIMTFIISGGISL